MPHPVDSSNLSNDSSGQKSISGTIEYDGRTHNDVKKSLIQCMELMNQELLVIQENIGNIVEQAGAVNRQLASLLQPKPKPKLEMAEKKE